MVWLVLHLHLYLHLHLHLHLGTGKLATTLDSGIGIYFSAWKRLILNVM